MITLSPGSEHNALGICLRELKKASLKRYCSAELEEYAMVTVRQGQGRSRIKEQLVFGKSSQSVSLDHSYILIINREKDFQSLPCRLCTVVMCWHEAVGFLNEFWIYIPC